MSLQRNLPKMNAEAQEKNYNTSRDEEKKNREMQSRRNVQNFSKLVKGSVAELCGEGFSIA